MFAARFDPLAFVEAQQKENVESSSSEEEEVVQETSQPQNSKDDAGDSNDEDMSDNYDDHSLQNELDNRKRRRSNDDSESESDDNKSSSSSDDESDSDQDSGHENNMEIDNTNGQLPQVDADDEYVQAHSSVFRRFKKTMNLQPKIKKAGLSKDDTKPEEPQDLKEIAPLPQPALPRDKNLYSNEQKNKSLNWLAEPTYHKTAITKPFAEIQPTLNGKIISNLNSEFGITSAFSVQISLIESLLKDTKRNRLDPTPFGDYLVNASTGSGKTLAYLVPIINTLIGRIVPRLRCIILVPTKPLITQVYSNVLSLIKGLNLNVMSFKNDVGLQEEHSRFIKLIPDILITTPGRLVDHIVNFDLSLTDLRFLVVDEADRLLNQSFQNWCDLVVNKIEKDQGLAEEQSFYSRFKLRCVKLILSATLTTNSEKLSHLKLFKPRVVVVNDIDNLVNELYQLPINLDEYFLNIPEVLSFYKPLILMYYLNHRNDLKSHGLIFVKSNESAIRLTRLLTILTDKFSIKLSIKSVNSTLHNHERQKILKDFDANGGILIATDLIARGLNLESIQFVVNYDLPLSTKEYVHRIGRTARANRHGRAITFVYGDGEFKWFKKLVYSGGVINRNKKEINEVKFVKEDAEVDSDQLKFELTLTDSIKEIYETSLKELESEVYNKK